MQIFACFVMFIGGFMGYVVSAQDSLKTYSELVKNKKIKIFQPKNMKELVRFIKTKSEPLGILNSGNKKPLHQNLLDLSRLNHIMHIRMDVDTPTLTWETGGRWQDVQKALDPYELSIKVLPRQGSTYVLESLNINAPGSHVGFGPIISAVQSIKLLTAAGQLEPLSRTQNPELFSAVLGGYGAFGIIVEATIELAWNKKLKKSYVRFTDNQTAALTQTYIEHVQTHILHAKNQVPVISEGYLYPMDCRTIDSVLWSESTEPLTEWDRFQKPIQAMYMKDENPWYDDKVANLAKYFRGHVLSSEKTKSVYVASRNYATSYAAPELVLLNRLIPYLHSQTYVIPIKKAPLFAASMCHIFRQQKAYVVYVSLHHTPKNTESLMNMSKETSLTFVTHYMNPSSLSSAFPVSPSAETPPLWIQSLALEALKHRGSYDFPHRVNLKPAQMLATYVGLCKLVQISKTINPTQKFYSELIELLNTKNICKDT